MPFSKTVELPLTLPSEGQFSFPDNLPIIMPYDPGGTTGWAYFNPFSLIVKCGQITGQHHLELNQHLELHLGRTIALLDQMAMRNLNGAIKTRSPREIICESFQFRQFTGFDKSKVELDSVEYIGVIKLYSQLSHTPLHFQTASVAKHFVSDDKLKRLGWYTPTAGMVHARDALRHLLYRLIVVHGVREPFTNQWLAKVGDKE